MLGAEAAAPTALHRCRGVADQDDLRSADGRQPGSVQARVSSRKKPRRTQSTAESTNRISIPRSARATGQAFPARLMRGSPANDRKKDRHRATPATGRVPRRRDSATRRPDPHRPGSPEPLRCRRPRRIAPAEARSADRVPRPLRPGDPRAPAPCRGPRTAHGQRLALAELFDGRCRIAFA